MKRFMKYGLMLMLLFVVGAHADNVVRLEGFSIQGNSEEPNVIYVTPWQPPPGTGRLYQSVTSYRQQWLQETDRDSFQRELRYAERYAPLKPDPEKLQQLTEMNH